MAVQFQAAAKILPLKAERPPAPKREIPQSEFKEHFDGARSAASAERRRPSDKPAPTDDIKPKDPVDENPEADESAEADAEQVVVAVAQPVTQNLVILPSEDDVAPAEFETKNPTRVDDQIRRARGPAETTNVGNRVDKPIPQPGGAKAQPVPVTNTPPVVDGEVASTAVTAASESESNARSEVLTPTRTTSTPSHDELTAAQSIDRPALNFVQPSSRVLDPARRSQSSRVNRLHREPKSRPSMCVPKAARPAMRVMRQTSDPCRRHGQRKIRRQLRPRTLSRGSIIVS